MSRAVEVAFHGAPPDTGNLGVTALFESVVAGLFRRLPDLRLTVFDHGYGTRPGRLDVDGVTREYACMGCRTSKRYYRLDTMATMDLMSRFGGLGNPGVAAMKRADAVLDISGGDSFTEIYGWTRFDCVAVPKRMALRLDRPLILLPQTYGPFEQPRYRDEAVRLVQAARIAWARDQRSFEVLRSLLGDQFDAERHQVGVDVAFGLVPRDPGDRLPVSVRKALDAAEKPVGFNVSGLIYNDPERARSQYRFRADYRQVLAELFGQILEDPKVQLFLVPHVRDGWGSDSDGAASREIHRGLEREHPGRVTLIDPDLDPGEIKWVIARMGWFCGTRMHSTIAGLSSAVPTATIAYSDKAKGVFESCGRGEHVVDPRALESAEVVARIMESYRRAEADRAPLVESLEWVRRRAEEQLDAIVAAL